MRATKLFMRNEEGAMVVAKVFALALCLALAAFVAMVGMGSMNVSAAPIGGESSLSIGGGNGTATSYFGLTVVGWIVAAGAVITLIGFIIIRDFRILIIDALLWIALLVIMYY